MAAVPVPVVVGTAVLTLVGNGRHGPVVVAGDTVFTGRDMHHAGQRKYQCNPHGQAAHAAPGERTGMVTHGGSYTMGAAPWSWFPAPFGRP